MIIETWMAIDPCVNLGSVSFELLDRISPEDVYSIKATDEETGHNKTKEHLARKMGK